MSRQHDHRGRDTAALDLARLESLVLLCTQQIQTLVGTRQRLKEDIVETRERLFVLDHDYQGPA